MKPRLVCLLRAHALAVLATASLLVTPWPAAAQEGVTTGAIVGRVTDADGQPLALAQVTVIDTERGTTREVLTNDTGLYVVGLLQPGTYTVRAEFRPNPVAEVRNVVVTVGERESVNIEIQPVAVSELRVSVAGRPAAVSAGGGVIEFVTEDQIANLPTAGRDFTDFIALSGLISPQPEISTGGQFSIGGARTSGTNIQVDGADANNAFFGENRGSSRLPFTFSLESIKEFQIITNGYDVEFGRFSGGVINAVTKGGTNEFYGRGHFFWRDEALTADNFDGQSPADFKSFQFGGVLSGPIVRDKVHFFLSGDFQERDQPVFALTSERSNIPAATIQEFQDILVNVYGFDPAEVAGNIGQFKETDDQANIFGRIDWQINNDNRLTIRANYSDFTNENDRLSTRGNEALTMAGTFLDEAISVVGELNSSIGSNVFNTLRLQYSDEDRPRPGNSTLPSVQVEVDDAQGGPIDIEYGGNFFGILFDNRLQEKKFQIVDNLTFGLGDHTLKIGTDNIFSNTKNRFWLNGNGFFTFDNLEDFRNRDPGFSFRFVNDLDNPTPPFADFDIREHAFYIQDSWQASEKLNLALGLRYDLTKFSDRGEPLADPVFRDIVENEFGIFSTDIPDDTDNWGPRFSFTYDATADERNVIRGGAGLFYGRLTGVLHGNVLQTTPKPILAVICIGSATPDFQYEAWEVPENIPSRCKFSGVQFPGGQFGLGIVGAPQITAWDPDTEQPETWKFNLGYERRLSDRWTAGVQAIFSRRINGFGAIEANLLPQQFTTADGRPVHASEDDFADFIEDRDAANNRERGINRTIDRILLQTSNVKARAWNFKFDVNGAPSDNFRLAANYVLTLAYDNSSVECCTAFAIAFEAPTAGNPNELGDFGDDLVGSWGPSRFERRHVFVANAIWDVAAGFQISAIYRAQSGNPFTPVVNGDVNGDGEDENDRPFIPDPDNLTGIQFASPGDLADYRELLGENACLRASIGRIIGRNRCRNPAWHSLNMKFSKGFDLPGGQGFDVILDLFNVLDGLGIDGGEFNFKRNRLFTAVDFDPDTNEVVYRVSRSFGEELPTGFEPLQFQAQLAVRYRFF